MTWKLSPTGATHGSSRLVVLFTSGDIHEHLRAVLADGGYEGAGSLTIADPPTHSLCAQCWRNEAHAWALAEGKPATTYENAAAKTTSAGMFYNTAARDYALEDRLCLDKVVSTHVHESMHWASRDHAGLQHLSDDPAVPGVVKGLSLDECFADTLGKATYEHMRAANPALLLGDYQTEYGRSAQFLDFAGDNLRRVPAYRIPEVRASMPDAVSASLQRTPPDKAQAAEELKPILFDGFAKGFFEGTDTPSPALQKSLGELTRAGDRPAFDFLFQGVQLKI